MLAGSPDISFFSTRPHSAPARFFNPPLTENREQAKHLNDNSTDNSINLHLNNNSTDDGIDLKGTLYLSHKCYQRQCTFFTQQIQPLVVN